mgnify:CR=1 FL=1
MGLPVGAIIIWKNAAATIPNGWQVCNGSNGTPDLRDYFVRGAAKDDDVGVQQNSGVHNHARAANTSTNGTHLHAMSVSVGGASGSTSTWDNQYGPGVAGDGHGHSGGSGSSGTDGNHSHTVGGNTNDADNSPPFLRLYYIMRVL